MRFRETELPGVLVVEGDTHRDDRGWFARTFDRESFARRGLFSTVVDANASFNARAGTLRGLHFQAAPHAEAKLVRCVRGTIWDVAADVRQGSPTRGRWVAVELGEGEPRALYVPEGFAHGFQTLRDATEVSYLMSARHAPEASRGVRWDDATLAIEWPSVTGRRIISDRDRALPALDP